MPKIEIGYKEDVDITSLFDLIEGIREIAVNVLQADDRKITLRDARVPEVKLVCGCHLPDVQVDVKGHYSPLRFANQAERQEQLRKAVAPLLPKGGHRCVVNLHLKNVTSSEVETEELPATSPMFETAEKPPGG